MLGAAAMMATFYFAGCQGGWEWGGGALFIKCRLSLLTSRPPPPLPPPTPTDKERRKKAKVAFEVARLADKQIVNKAIIHPDSAAYRRALEGRGTAAPQEFPLVFLGAQFLNRRHAAKLDKSSIHAPKDTEALAARTHVDARRDAADVDYISRVVLFA